ncbi:MAG: hypothetical protein LBH26_04795 [Treponema sp.]|jgi:hypothetical protein|nr:hypothetical protein [Treponema sp.]
MGSDYETCFGESGKSVVGYADFGALGDGKTDDTPALIRAHTYANKQGLPVAADSRTYYLAPSARAIPVMTDTDWGNARFIIDDHALPPEERMRPVFHIKSAHEPVPLHIGSLKKNQGKIDAELPCNSLVIAVNEDSRQFRRVGLNVDKGSPQTDCFMVDKSGAVLNPILWDFEKISSITAYPMDRRSLSVKGGIFTTIANQAPSEYTYYDRGLRITRSNVIVDGTVHLIEGEKEQGAPYSGFLNADSCARVRFLNCHLSPHYIYTTIGSAGLPVKMGSYGISLNRCVDISFINCRHDNVMDKRYWGIFGSNYCKDILVDGCVFSRVDAHKGVANYTVKNSLIGYMGLKATGSGLMRVENVSLLGDSIDLRADYGSAWEGDLFFKDVTWRPANPGACLIGALNRGGHDFGYPCRLPRKIVIENLTVLDGDMPAGEGGEVSILPAHPETNGDLKSWTEKAPGDEPYVFTEILEVRGVKTQSGRGFRLFSAPPEKCYAAFPGEVKGEKIIPNFRAFIDDAEGVIISLSSENLEYDGTHRLLPDIRIRNCPSVKLDRGKNPGIIKTE